MVQCFMYSSCVITELFTEGTAPFDLSQLLAYRNREYSPWKVLEKIEDTSVRVGYNLLRQISCFLENQKDLTLALIHCNCKLIE